jgi:hypothetical protein
LSNSIEPARLDRHKRLQADKTTGVPGGAWQRQTKKEQSCPR